jgi:hypothetical protein
MAQNDAPKTIALAFCARQFRQLRLPFGFCPMSNFSSAGIKNPSGQRPPKTRQRLLFGHLGRPASRLAQAIRPIVHTPTVTDPCDTGHGAGRRRCDDVDFAGFSGRLSPAEDLVAGVGSEESLPPDIAHEFALPAINRCSPRSARSTSRVVGPGSAPSPGERPMPQAYSSFWWASTWVSNGGVVFKMATVCSPLRYPRSLRLDARQSIGRSVTTNAAANEIAQVGGSSAGCNPAGEVILSETSVFFKAILISRFRRSRIALGVADGATTANQDADCVQ